ncbi:30S ribosome-binding factor RbfA [Neptuniibacter sp. UBA847]|jgi:ribosome-binding factor A|uniref:30S ribosome-binding factor RbfA n=1 Tax=Neptuniibacter sp. UBA847 TaxID=1946977 RepID=UPI000C6896D0|nr:30S ribosome-binding factor RbfA [Neptuniibacter sp. UBA847]MAY42555.1 ribosome-binding factor A [Oceanospirillaceae bacterium]|tara:strand:- start:19425 stop:19826 length:402 start_codon:yes stop_codon:yes gene_type:complete
MARDYSRTSRIADQLQRELAQIIQLEIQDPRLGMVTVSYTKVSKDLGYADVYITVLPLNGKDEDEAIVDSLKVLNNAAGFIRGILAKQVKLRVMPALRFHFDETIERGRHLHHLIEATVREENQKKDNDTDGE